MTRPLRVFLCHSSNDKPTVRELYQKLRAESWIQPWLDEEELYPGQDWNMEIEKAVESADVIIVCLTKGSITKEGYVQRELRTVLDFADYKPEGTLYIIPVRLEECEPPRRLRAWQYADYFEGQHDRAFQRLLVSLKRRADGLGLAAEELDARQINEQAKPETAKKIARQETPAHEAKKSEEQIISAPIAEELKKEEPKKEIPAKPFTKLLDPSTLSPKGTSSPQDGKQSVKKSVPNNNVRWLGIGGIILLVLIFGGFGLNYLINSLLGATATSQLTKTPISVPTIGIGSTMIGDKDETLVYVPAGEFPMGSNISRSIDATKQACETIRITVQQNDTLASIAANYAVSQEAIKIFNGITINDVFINQTLLIPLCMRSETTGSTSVVTILDSNAYLDEQPIHTVYLDAYWIDQTEVTNKQYKACVDAGTCEPPSSTNSNTHPNYYGNPEFNDYPVIYVNWDKANRYCEVWTGGDLPTEAQWEKAARGTDARTYPWGDDAPNKDLLNYSGNIGDTTVVKNYLNTGSFYGTYDMAGNVWEWVNDWYGENYYQNSNSTNNPLGPESGNARVLRGGSWNVNGNDSRSALRFGGDPAGALNNVGFRCARSASP
jgi:formylglycine-generating enzyme required for sulfatase activity